MGSKKDTVSGYRWPKYLENTLNRILQKLVMESEGDLDSILGPCESNGKIA